MLFRSLGGKVLACSDTKGWVEDPDGIDYKVLEGIYNKKRSGHDRGVSLALYVEERPGATWHAEDGRGVWIPFTSIWRHEQTEEYDHPRLARITHFGQLTNLVGAERG